MAGYTGGWRPGSATLVDSDAAAGSDAVSTMTLQRIVRQHPVIPQWSHVGRPPLGCRWRPRPSRATHETDSPAVRSDQSPGNPRFDFESTWRRAEPLESKNDGASSPASRLMNGYGTPPGFAMVNPFGSPILCTTQILKPFTACRRALPRCGVTNLDGREWNDRNHWF